jgi:hypothetical protein
MPLGYPGKAVTGVDPRARRPAVVSAAYWAGCLGVVEPVVATPVSRSAIPAPRTQSPARYPLALEKDGIRVAEAADSNVLSAASGCRGEPM